MTCPMPRRLMSTKRRTSEDAHNFSQFAKNSFIAGSLQCSERWFGGCPCWFGRSTPEKRWRKVHAGHLFANKAPNLANLCLNLRALPASDLEDEAGFVGQPAGARGYTEFKVNIGWYARQAFEVYGYGTAVKI